MLRLAKQTSIKPRSIHQLLLVSTGEGLIEYATDEQLAQREQLMFAKNKMKVLLIRPYYILTVNSTKVEIHNSKHIFITQASNTLCTVFDQEVASYQTQMIDQKIKIQIIMS